MNPIIGQYVYGYVPYIDDYHGIYEITLVTDRYFLVCPVISRLTNDRPLKCDWAMPKSAITIMFDTTDLNTIKRQHPELFI